MRALRIVVVTQSYHPVHGGIGEHARALGLALQTRGHRVTVLTSGPPPRGGELPGIEVVRIGRRFEVPSNGSRASLAFHPLFRRAVRTILQSGIDVVHVHSPLEPFLPWAVLREAEVPCVGTFHNAGPVPWGYRYFARRLTPLVEKLAVRTAVSRCAAVYVGRHFPGDFLVIPNGIDPDRFRPGPRGASDRPPTVLFVGRLERRKGLDLLVRGVALASRRTGRRLRLLVVGDGSLRGRLLRNARRAGVDLRWLGNVDPSLLPHAYRQADLLAAPALYGESFGIVLLEALASGIPVVASRIEGFAELLEGCRAAHLFPPADAIGLATGIEDLLGRNGEPLDSIARRHALAYRWDRVAIRMEGAYREALGGAPAEVERVLYRAGRSPAGRRGTPGPAVRTIDPLQLRVQADRDDDLVVEGDLLARGHRRFDDDVVRETTE